MCQPCVCSDTYTVLMALLQLQLRAIDAEYVEKERNKPRPNYLRQDLFEEIEADEEDTAPGEDSGEVPAA
jgi:hypothetical protein